MTNISGIAKLDQPAIEEAVGEIEEAVGEYEDLFDALAHLTESLEPTWAGPADWLDYTDLRPKIRTAVRAYLPGLVWEDGSDLDGLAFGCFMLGYERATACFEDALGMKRKVLSYAVRSKDLARDQLTLDEIVALRAVPATDGQDWKASYDAIEAIFEASDVAYLTDTLGIAPWL